MYISIRKHLKNNKSSSSIHVLVYESIKVIVAKSL